jgi:hypothetical protein
MDNEDLFHIDFLTGQLYTKALLDYETYSTYRLYAIAIDNDNLHSDRVLVTIELIDINDHSPIIETPSLISISSEYLRNNLSQTMIITTIIANDHDTGGNGNLTYTIIDGNENDYFQINVYNGTIIGDRNNLSEGYYHLTIKVCDQSELFEKCSSIILNIQIGDEINRYFNIEDNLLKKNFIQEENLLTNQIILVIIISSIFTLTFSVIMGILCTICCKQKRYHRSSLNKPCELLQSSDVDKLLSTNQVSYVIYIILP